MSKSQSTSSRRQRLHSKQHSIASVLFNFFSSMELAVSILVVIAIAAIIGTVLQQNQPYNDYIIKFGVFWFDVFKALGLFNIYSSTWFVLLLGFLLLSTSVCLYRNTPVMIKEWRSFRLQITEKSLQLMHMSAQRHLSMPLETVQNRVQALLQQGGYQYKSIVQADGAVLIAAKKGAMSRLGYILSHLSIIVIALGALSDGNLYLRYKALQGTLQPETRDIPASEVPAISRLSAEENPAFRGNISLPEGYSTRLVFLPLDEGYLVQDLPFTVHLKDFRITHYASGQPKSFESDILIYEHDIKNAKAFTVAVNHPVIYKGYAIYQASFEDGGSVLQLAVHALDRKAKSRIIDTTVGQNYPIASLWGDITLEMEDFRLFNINPNPDAEKTGKKFINLGPSFTFKVRNAEGEATQFENYMSPIMQQGRAFFLTGMRNDAAKPYQFLHIPADDKHSLQRFFAFLQLLQDKTAIHTIAVQATTASLLAAEQKNTALIENIAQSMTRLIDLFLAGGFEGIVKYIETNVPKEKRSTVNAAYMKVLQSILVAAYREVLNTEGITRINEKQALFYDDAINAIASLPAYGIGFYLQLKDFTHIQASGFQITKSPGQNIVYLGCILLITGIFFLFYLSHKRIWFRLTEKGASETTLQFAGSGERHQKAFEKEFIQLTTLLDANTTWQSVR